MEYPNYPIIFSYTTKGKLCECNVTEKLEILRRKAHNTKEALVAELKQQFVARFRFRSHLELVIAARGYFFENVKYVQILIMISSS